MAAHIKTYIDEALSITDFGIKEFEQFHQAISFAKLGDCLHNEDWTSLYYEDEPETFIEKLKALKPKYEEMWKSLGEPSTVEEWFEKKYQMRLQKESTDE